VTWDLWSTALVSLFLVGAAGGLILWHLRAWRQVARETTLEERERDFRWRQFRRRMQTSAMLGLLGVAIFVGRLLMAIPASPLVIFVYWGGVLVLLLWMFLLALVDAWATRYHFSRMRHECFIEQVKLQAEVDRLRAAGGNGRAPGKPHRRKGHK
jgi:hypothetical protein